MPAIDTDMSPAEELDTPDSFWRTGLLSSGYGTISSSDSSPRYETDLFRLRAAVRFGDMGLDVRDTRPPAQECRRAMLPSRRRVCPGVGARTEKLPRRSSARMEEPRESITLRSGLYTSSHTWKTLAPRMSWRPSLFSFRTVRQSCEERDALFGSGMAGALGIASCVTDRS